MEDHRVTVWVLITIGNRFINEWFPIHFTDRIKQKVVKVQKGTVYVYSQKRGH